MKRKGYLIFVAGVCLAMLVAVIPLSACGQKYTAENPLVLDYATWLPPALPEHDVILAFYQGLEDATGGAVKTEFHWAGVMGKPEELYGLAVDGVIDIAHFGAGYMPGVFPMLSIFEPPINFPSAEVFTKAMMEMYNKGYFDDDLADVKLIEMHTIGPYNLIWAKDKVTTLEQMKGKKLRCPTEGHVNVSKAVGAVPVSTPSAESYSNLEKGIVDADWQIFDSAYVYKLQEIAKYATEMRLMTFLHVIVMNKDTWNELPQAGKDYIEQNSYNQAINASRAYDAHNASGKKVYQDAGTEVVELAPGEREKLDELLAPLWTQWIDDREAQGLPAKKAADDFAQIFKDLGVEGALIGY